MDHGSKRGFKEIQNDKGSVEGKKTGGARGSEIGSLKEVRKGREDRARQCDRRGSRHTI